MSEQTVRAEVPEQCYCERCNTYEPCPQNERIQTLERRIAELEQNLENLEGRTVEVPEVGARIIFVHFPDVRGVVKHSDPETGALKVTLDDGASGHFHACDVVDASFSICEYIQALESQNAALKADRDAKKVLIDELTRLAQVAPLDHERDRTPDWKNHRERLTLRACEALTSTIGDPKETECPKT